MALTGPGGVGKSLLAQELASAFYGDAEAAVELNGNDLADRTSVSRLLGPPPGDASPAIKTRECSERGRGAGHITVLQERFRQSVTGRRLLLLRIPGYVGYGQGGELTEPIRRRPHSLVIIDSIDMAHPEVQEMISQARSASGLLSCPCAASGTRLGKELLSQSLRLIGPIGRPSCGS